MVLLQNCTHSKRQKENSYSLPQQMTELYNITSISSCYGIVLDPRTSYAEEVIPKHSW
jgi:hypothetical protein